MIESRKDVRDLEELKEYLKTHTDSELPFNERAWADAIVKSEENMNKMKNDPNLTTEKVVYRGGKKVIQKAKKHLQIDPVQIYWKLMNLKTYRDESLTINAEKREYMETVANAQLSDDFQNATKNEVVLWIDRVIDPLEKSYLQRRYLSYVTSYEVNEGADMISLKRILSLELETYRIDNDRVAGKDVDINLEKRVNESLLGILESLKWTKKQRSNMDDMSQNKFTVFMDKMVKNGGYVPTNVNVEKDDIDFLLEQFLDGVREMLI